MFKVSNKSRGDVNTMDAHGETTLLKACRMENGTFVKILLDSGAERMGDASLGDLSQQVSYFSESTDKIWR